VQEMRREKREEKEEKEREGLVEQLENETISFQLGEFQFNLITFG
jgi:hypothetical protein